jgi:hypothetical protein
MDADTSHRSHQSSTGKKQKSLNGGCSRRSVSTAG